MQTDSTSPRRDLIFTMKLIWGAFVLSGIIYGILLGFLLRMASSQAEAITQFSQIVPRKEFMVSVLIGFFLVTLSRLLPKFLLRSRLKKNPSTHRQQVIENYMPGFILGLACLEILALVGFYTAFQFRFLPVYWVFGFVAVANMLIRFPSWAYIKFLAEETIGKPFNF